MYDYNFFELGNRSKFKFPFYKYEYGRKKADLIFLAHWHKEIEITLCNCSGEMKIENDLVKFKKDDIIIVNSQYLHSMNSYEAGDFDTILFDLSMLNSITDLRFDNKLINNILNEGYVFANKICDTYFLNLFHELFKVDENEQFLVLSYIYMILYYFKSKNLIFKNLEFGKHTNIDHLKNALDYMEKNFKKKIKISEICDEIGLSEGHFIRLFKKEFLVTPVQYLIYIRLKHAHSKLENGASVTYAAYSSGFESVSYFIKQYKKFYGITPSEKN